MDSGRDKAGFRNEDNEAVEPFSHHFAPQVFVLPTKECTPLRLGSNSFLAARLASDTKEEEN